MTLLRSIMFFVPAFALLATGCKIKKSDIEDAIVAANYCNVTGECTTISQCPFGCYRPVNEAEVADLENMIREWEDQESTACDYDCGEEPGDALVCEQGECVYVDIEEE